MSSSPTYTLKFDALFASSFKALSRMSSSPTNSALHTGGYTIDWFQSAVAHELFSDRDAGKVAGDSAIVSKRCRA